MFSKISDEDKAANAHWEKIKIPGAVCGDGAPYHIFVRWGDREKLAIGFAGGGACWDFFTCIGPAPLTWIHPLPFIINLGGILSRDPKVSAVADYTHVFFPYCTGDAFFGNHTARYLAGFKVYHYGRTNVEMGLKHLQGEGLLSLETARKVVLHGSSAGAIGALVHLKTVEPYLALDADRVVIADAPGLHFGPNFWNKFTPSQMVDFKGVFSQVGIQLGPGMGNIASQIQTICHYFSQWRIGILQGSRDIVMSALFGSISPRDHDDLVYGENGLFQKTLDPTDTCSAWVPQTHFHTFLATGFSVHFNIMGVSAGDYVREIVEGGERELRNYRGKMNYLRLPLWKVKGNDHRL